LNTPCVSYAKFVHSFYIVTEKVHVVYSTNETNKDEIFFSVKLFSISNIYIIYYYESTIDLNFS